MKKLLFIFVCFAVFGNHDWVRSETVNLNNVVKGTISDLEKNNYSFNGGVLVPYTLTANDVTFSNGVITGYTNTSETSIVIPDNFNGVTVTGIGNNAFDSENLTSLILPNTITAIGSRAFYNNSLTSLTIPSSVVSIGASAFMYNSLKTVVFESNSNIKNIWGNAFYGNPLSSIQLPTHANSGFINYSDGSGNSYQPGAQITNFSTFYYAPVPYTLTANDVIFSNGVITGYTNTSETSIVIPDNFNGVTVTGIGNNAFNSKNLTSLILPNTISTIGYRAFYSNSLTSLTIPSSVVSIGVSAFMYNSLKTVVFESNSNIKNIWGSAFSWNTLSSIQLPTNTSSGFINYGDGSGNSYQPGAQITNFDTFYYALVPYTLTANDVTFSNGLITGYTNTSETSIVIPDNFNGVTVTGIGNNAFDSKSLTSLTLPNTITSIGYRAFYSNSLTSLIIPSSVVSIGVSAFMYNSLKTVVFESNSNVKNIWGNAFSWNSLSSIQLPTNNSSGFVNYSDGGGNSYQPGAQITNFSTFYYALVPYTLTANDVTFSNGVITGYTNTSETSIVIPDNFNGAKVNGIGNNAFDSKSLTSLTLPNTITTIGYRAFYSNSLTSLIIPSSVVSIGVSAFMYNSLKTVVFESNSNIKNIWGNAFSWNSLSSIQLPTNTNSGFVNYCDGGGNSYQPGAQITNFSTFYYALVPYTLTANDVTFSNGVITGYTNISETSIVIPDNFNGVKVTGIGNNAFDSKSLTSLTLPGTITTIGYRAFYSNSLTSLIIPSSVVSIGVSAFMYNSLKAVVFESNSNIKNIWGNAFSWNSLSSIQLPTNTNSGFVNYCDGGGNSYQPGAQITNLSTFYYALVPYTLTANDVTFSNGVITGYTNTSETSIVIPDNFNGVTVTGIGNNAFDSKNLTSLTLPNTITTIGYRAFYSNSLTSLTIPSSVVSIGVSAFMYNSLNTVVFESNNNIKNIWGSAFSWNPLSSIQLPTHASSGFVKYGDRSRSLYKTGDNITDYSQSYFAIIKGGIEIKYDEMKNDNLASFNEIDSYKFLASKGDSVVLKVYSSNMGFTPSLYLISPNDSIEVITGEKGAAISEQRILKESGYFELLICGAENHSSADYTLQVQGRIETNIIDAADYKILKDFYNTNSGTSWVNQWDVSSDTINSKNWYGVSFRDGYVTSISLVSNQLKGDFPLVLFTLPKLRTLNLYENQLTGKIDSTSANLALLKSLHTDSLTSLNLGKNLLKGQIPLLFNSFSRLIHLNLEGNKLHLISAPLPVHITDLNIQNQEITVDSVKLSVTPELNLPTLCMYNHANQSLDFYPTFSLLSKGNNIGSINYSANKYQLSWVNPLGWTYESGQALVLRQQNGQAMGTNSIFKLFFNDGDANIDQKVDLLDVQHSLNYVLGDNPQPFNFSAADTYKDTVLTVQDIVRTVNIILSSESDTAVNGLQKSKFAMGSANHLYIENDNLVLTAEESVAALDVTLLGISDKQLRLMLNNSSFQMIIRNIPGGGTRFIVFSPTGDEIKAGKTIIAELYNEKASLLWAKLSNKTANNVSVSLNNSAETGLEHLSDLNIPVYALLHKAVIVLPASVERLHATLCTAEGIMLDDRILTDLSAGKTFIDYSSSSLSTGVYILKLSLKTQGKVLNKNTKLIITK